jgi:hypothetical protein
VLSAMEWSVAHNYYVADPTKISIDKVRQEAMEHAFDDRHPEHSVIHFHAYDPDAGWCISEGEHEQYRAMRGKVG